MLGSDVLNMRDDDDDDDDDDGLNFAWTDQSCIFALLSSHRFVRSLDRVHTGTRQPLASHINTFIDNRW